MAFEIVTSINIESTPEKIWAVLSNFDQYADWNPFIKSIKGNVQEGEQIHVMVEGMSFKPIVLSFKQNQQLIWRGRMISSWLFEGTHKFIIEPLSGGTCNFVHSEKFSGALLPLLKSKLKKETKPGFESMNVAIKERVEA